MQIYFFFASDSVFQGFSYLLSNLFTFPNGRGLRVVYVQQQPIYVAYGYNRMQTCQDVDGNHFIYF